MISFKEENSALYMKAEGHITAQCCPQLKRKVFERIDIDPPVNHIYVDLSECTYMDSTFLGLLVGFSRHISARGGKLEVQHADEVSLSLFRQMGMDRILSINQVTVPLPENMVNMQNNSSLTADELLSAHEDLMSISDDNKKRFLTLHEILSKQVKEKKDSEN
ncbi:MAG: STAS domain-containing protein [Spirochaetaceae bacterium]|jgi:anti-anti-sigma factor|nr:STAS domain-containing protein [Spirochaetaceae bacterium]